MKKATRLLPVIVCLFIPLILWAGEWESGPPLITPREGATSVVLNGSIYVLGGKTNNNTILNTVEIFDPVSGAWDETSVAPFNIPRFNAAAVVFNGQIYLTGGRDPSNDVLKKVERYNPAQNTWVEVQEMRKEREGHSALIFNNKIYAFGGSKSNGNPVDDVEWYDLPNDEWRDAEFDLISPRVAHFSTVVNDTFFIFGGFYYGPTNTTFFISAFDSVWHNGPALQTFRGYGATAQVGDSIYLMGGETFNGDTDTTEIYDLRTQQIRLGTPILSPRKGMTAVTLNERIYLIGGFSSNLNQPLDNVDIYSVITGISPPGEPVIVIDNAEITGFPNPFNGRITLKLQIPFRGQSNLTIFDLLGKKVKTLHSGILNKGTHQFSWEATDNADRKVTSGIYFAVLRGQNYSRNFKIFYVR